MMDYRSLTYDLCRRYILDQKGLIPGDIIDLTLGWVRARDLDRLCNAVDLIPSAYSSRDLCRFSRQVAAFFKKNKQFSDKLVCEEAARTSFERAERICRITNKRLDYYYLHRERLTPQVDTWLRRAEHICNDVLGDFGVFMDVLPTKIRVTSGATATRSRREALPHLKTRMRHLVATEPAIPFLEHCAAHYGLRRFSVDVVESNRVETVPKNWKTDRTIACEPEGNLFLQLAFDTFVKERLRKKLKVNLSDQSENQRLAREASISGKFATIDFSMASDTVSLNAVYWLFPHWWSSYLRAIRAPKGVGFGKQFIYAKLSSMGNGATFTVETLIFAALAKAVGSKAFKVYGDDVIIETELAEDFCTLAKFLGFQINAEKSFKDGPFRESCGSDCYSGVDVTPFYVRFDHTNKPGMCHLVNGLAPLSYPKGELAQLLQRIVEENRLPLIPWNWSSASGVWIHPHDAYALKLIRNKGWIQRVLAFTPKTRKLRIRDSRTLFLWHLNASRRENGDPLMRQRHFSSLPMWEDYDSASTSSIISSSVPIFTHRYVRKWVCWLPPAMATPGHLYWWSETLVRRKADQS